MWGNKKSKYHSKITSIIGKGTEVRGDIHFSGGLHIDGKVVGSIYPTTDDEASLTISEFGIVEGEIHIPNIIVNGIVEGDIYSSNHLELVKKARVHGNVNYNIIEMAIGAEVNGALLKGHTTLEALDDGQKTLQSSDSALLEHESELASENKLEFEATNEEDIIEVEPKV